MIFTAFERTHNLECEAYANPKLFPYPTEIMKKTCPEQFMKGGE